MPNPSGALGFQSKVAHLSSATELSPDEAWGGSAASHAGMLWQIRWRSHKKLTPGNENIVACCRVAVTSTCELSSVPGPGSPVGHTGICLGLCQSARMVVFSDSLAARGPAPPAQAEVYRARTRSPYVAVTCSLPSGSRKVYERVLRYPTGEVCLLWPAPAYFDSSSCHWLLQLIRAAETQQDV